MERVRLKDLVSLKTKKTEKNYYPYLEIGDVDIFDGKYILKDKKSVVGAILAKKNDLLVSKVRPTRGAITTINENEISVSSGFAVLENKENISHKYLFYILKYNKSFLEYLGKVSKGATYPTCSSNDILEYSIPNYTFDKQKEIANELDKIQEIMDIRKKQIKDFDNIIKSRFVEIFGDPDTNPYGYEVKKINEVSELIKGITYSPEQVADEGIIVLRSGNIKGSNFDLQDLVKITKDIDESKWVKENDILMCNRNGSARLVGKVTKIPKLNEEMTFGTFMTIVRSDYYEYLFVFFQTEAFRRQIQFQTAVAINQISLPLLADVNVPIPPIDLQIQFATFVQQVNKLKFETQKSLGELEKLQESLMQKYLS